MVLHISRTVEFEFPTDQEIMWYCVTCTITLYQVQDKASPCEGKMFGLRAAFTMIKAHPSI